MPNAVARALLCLMPMLAVSAFSTPLHAADSGTLPARVESALQSAKIPSDAVALAVIPLEGQGMAQFINADTPVNPASTMKLVTTYAALEILGPTHQWRSDLFVDGPVVNGTLQGDLIFRSGGDPKLTLERMWLMLRDLKAAGIRDITGDLVLQPADLRLPNDIPPFIDDSGNQNRPFLVEPDPLLTNLKVLVVSSYGEQNGIRVNVEPALPEVKVVNQLTLLPATSNCPRPNVAYDIQDEGYQATITLTGTLHENCIAQRYLTALTATTYTASTLRTLWQEMGGTIQGGTQIGRAPASSRLVAQSWSPDLVDVVRDINKWSNNTMARQLFLTIGRENRIATDRDDHKAAVRVINEWLRGKGIQANTLVMENGSGLSRMERLTARDMAQLLAQAWQSPYRAEFIASMPLAAMDGTMRRRLRNTPVAGQAHIKTGSLRNVKAIAGITRDANGQSWAVTAIVNHVSAGASGQALDLVLQDVYRRVPTDIATAQ
tara:strand:- start:81 stop:1553 length:1473 start_codon:yes stop_codon:yes gene_type:complete